jgi:prolyl 4-hydroxylase
MKEIKDFINPSEATYLIKMIDQYAEKSMVVGRGLENNVISKERTSYTANLIANDPTIQSLHKKIAKYLGVSLNKGESLQGQRYEKGQYFRDHVDYFTNTDYDKNCLSSGNRTFTFMLYLNDNYKGGYTNFKHLKKSIKPEACKGIVWNNLQNGHPNEYMMHSGMEVLEGTKYIITSWWRENAWIPGEDQKEYQKKLKSSQLSII